MAKQGARNKFGVTFPDAYIVSATTAIDYIGQSGHASFQTFADKAARDAGEAPIDSRAFSQNFAEVHALLTPSEMVEYQGYIDGLRKFNYILASRTRDLKPGYTDTGDGTYSDSAGNSATEAEATSNFFDGMTDV